MMTSDTYFSEIKNIPIRELPEVLRKGHELTEKAAQDDWFAYRNSETIRRTVDIYFSKLSEWKEKQEILPAKVVKTANEKTKPARKSKAKEAVQSKESDSAKGEKTVARAVEKLPPEVAFLKRYTLMNGKVKTQAQILAFIHSLQKAMLERQIGKASPYSREIEQVQDQLIACYEKMEDTVLVEIEANNLAHYRSIVNDYDPMFSVVLLKRYIALNGKRDVKEKAERLILQMREAVEKKRISRDDKYAGQLEKALATLTAYAEGKSKILRINQTELSGLQGGLGFVGTLAKGIVTNLIANAIDRKIQKSKEGTVLNSLELAGLEFETLPLLGEYRQLIGIPSRNFTAMIYGMPGSGKTTFCLRFAKYLAESHRLTVLFATIEEGINHTIKDKINRLGIAHDRLIIADHMPKDLRPYQVVFVDSVNSFGYDTKDLRALRKRYPEIIFLYIFQTTKEGKFKGSQEFEHDVDLVIKSDAGTVTTQGCKNRFGGSWNIMAW